MYTASVANSFAKHVRNENKDYQHSTMLYHVKHESQVWDLSLHDPLSQSTPSRSQTGKVIAKLMGFMLQ